MMHFELSRWHIFWIFLAWLIFVVYGSLLPFDLREHTLDQALARFAEIPYLDLGVGSRADWIANIVLYVPLGFLGCALVGGLRRLPGPVVFGVAVLVLGFSLALAIAVEFTQLFFAPRTVSLNDLLAELLGALAGIAMWIAARTRARRLIEAFAECGRESVTAAIAAYALFYVALSLFPYDFLVSASELGWKLDSGKWGWLLSGSCGGWLSCSARLAGDAIGIAPLGLLLGLLVPQATFRRAFAAGALLGLVLEALQLLLASGATQGASALMRGAGLAAGVAGGRHLLRVGPVPVARLIWRAAPFALVPYALLIAAVHGWFSGSWLPLGEGLGRMANVRLLPFYYHYYSTEPVAMASLLANAAMYAPVGIILWAWKTVRIRSAGPGAGAAAFWALGLAAVIELGKLWISGKHPDPTNLLIAAAAAAFAYGLARWLGRLLAEHEAPRARRAAPAPEPPPPRADVAQWPAPHPLAALAVVPVVLAVVVGLAAYPVGAPLLAIGLLTYGIWLWRRPLHWLFVVPALLPVLDLSLVTGRLLLDELDLVVLVTLGVGWLRSSRLAPAPWPHPLLRIALVLLWLTWAVATLRGLWPLLSSSAGLGGALAASSHSPLEAWMVGKGLLWALLLVPLLRRVPRDALATAQTLVLDGLVAGLAVLTLAVLWERHVFVGLLDFNDVFRVTGTFASMNTGGAYIEAFIAFAFPALVIWTLRQRIWLLRLLGVALAALVIYAMLVTYSRGGYAGLAAGLLVVAVGVLRWRQASRGLTWGILGGLAAVAIAIAVPVLTSGFAEQRLARSLQDLTTRLSHWERALGLMDPGLSAALIGMGFGQYPSLYLLAAAGDRPPGTYSVMTEAGNPYLRLGAGEAVFLDQVVDVEPGAAYQLVARVRTPYGAGSLRVPLCEKALLYSFACQWQTLAPDPLDRDWVALRATVETGHLGKTGRWPRPPVKLSLHNAGSGPIDVDDVRLRGSDGRELIANGGFSDGVKRWLMVSDQHLAWHVKQLLLETYFALGLVGVIAAFLLLVASALVLWPTLRVGEPWALALSAGLVGFLVVGLLSNVTDASRLILLFYLAPFCGTLLARSAHPDASPGLSEGDDLVVGPRVDRAVVPRPA